VPKLSIVTTSWDDGDPRDLQVAEFLRARGLAGTFYIPIIGYDGRRTLDPEHLRSLASEGFEIGGHGASHNVLTGLQPIEIHRELRICKRRLEDIVGKRVRMFCYPKGRFNNEVMLHVKQNGYEGARTTRMFRQGLDFDPVQMPTSLVAYPNIRNLYAKNLLRGRNIRALFTYGTQLIHADSWVTVGKALFDHVLREGGVWHLYGHSWQIEEMGLWDDLKEILDYVCGRDGVLYVTNAEVLTFLAKKAAVPLRKTHPARLE
jgi:peptidoglycan/xylan/chitin deacetylase (PgdA/CDA1 family)